MTKEEFLLGKHFYNKHHPKPDGYRYKVRRDEFGRNIIVRTDAAFHSGIYVDEVLPDGTIKINSYGHYISGEPQPVLNLSDLVLSDLNASPDISGCRESKMSKMKSIKIWDSRNEQWLDPISIHFNSSGIIWKVLGVIPGEHPLREGYYDITGDDLKKIAMIGSIVFNTEILPTDKKP